VLLAACGARTGIVVPEAPVEEVCTTPTDEVCNTLDDDCDGAIDEGLGFGVVGGPYEIANEMPGLFTSDLVVVEGGMVSVWNVGFDGSHPPHTNAFARHLGIDGRPDADTHAILDRPVTTGLTAEPSPRGVALMYCGRFGADDRPASGFLDAHGDRIAGEARRGTDGLSCGAVAQSVAWTGSAHLYSWITNGGTTDGTYPVFLDVADRDGTTLGGRVVEAHGDVYTGPTFARSGGITALAYGVRPELRRSAIDVVRLASDGSPIGSAIRVGDADVAERSFGSAHVVSDGAGGFVVLAADPNGPGVYAARVDAHGMVTRTLSPIESSVRRFDQLDASERPGGGIVLAANAYTGPDSTLWVAVLDRELNVMATWEPGAEIPYALVPAIEARGGRIFVQGGNVDGHRLEVRELGCLPR
jgi:hypothetical protein